MKTDVKYLKTVEYKSTANSITVEYYQEMIPVYIERMLEGMYANGYNACLDDVAIYLPKGVIVSKSKKRKRDTK